MRACEPDFLCVAKRWAPAVERAFRLELDTLLVERQRMPEDADVVARVGQREPRAADETDGGDRVPWVPNEHWGRETGGLGTHQTPTKCTDTPGVDILALKKAAFPEASELMQFEYKLHALQDASQLEALKEILASPLTEGYVPYCLPEGGRPA